MAKLRYSNFSSRIDIDAFEEAIGFVPFSHDRGNDIGHCVFPDNHKNGDTTGKFAIERDKRVWNCFVCGGGDLLSLAMLVTDKDTEQATEWLYQFAHGEQQTDGEFADELISMLDDMKEKIGKAKTLPFFNERVLDRFNTVTPYFEDRGISEAVIEKYGLRYGDEVTKTSPIKTTRDGEKIKAESDYVGPASIWPHYWQGRLVGWQYRWHDYPNTPKWLPKWTNTTDFPKSTTLYNYDEALNSRKRVVVCESLGTVLFLATHGVPAVAYFGSKPTDEQLRLLRRFNQGVILAPDNDSNKAGDQIYRAVDYLERYIPVYIAEKVEGEDGADLGDYAYSDDPRRYLQLHLEHRTHLAGTGLDL